MTVRPEITYRAAPRSTPAWLERLIGSDHKSVARLQIGGALTFLVAALAAFALLRVQLIVPDGTLLSPEIFAQLLSVSGVSLAVLFAVPLILGLGGLVLPLQIGARGVAFPRLNLLGAWLGLVGGATIYLSFLYTPPDAGPLALAPLSQAVHTPGHGVDAWIVGVGLACLGFTLQAINLLVTARSLRAPGLFWRRVPIFTWAVAAISWVLLIVAPIMFTALALLSADRNFGAEFFTAAGSPLVYQHLAHLFAAGVSAVVVLFAAGVLSEVLPVFARRPLPSRRTVAACIVGLAALIPLAWMQDMYNTPIAPGWAYTAMIVALLALIPIGLLFSSWLRSLWGGTLVLRAPMLYALAAASTLAFGLGGELIWSVVPVGWQYTNTAASQATATYVLVGGGLMAGLAGLSYWLPKLTGRAAGNGLARFSVLLMLIGVHAYAIPMVFAGLAGQPADVYTFFAGTGLDSFNLIASIGAFVLVVGALVGLGGLAHAFGAGRRVGPDPWGGDTLEWFADSPPPPHNFDEIPDVRSDRPLSDIRELVKQRTGHGDA